MKRRSKRIKRTRAPYTLCKSLMHNTECDTYQFTDGREMRISDLIDILKHIRADYGVVNMTTQVDGQCGHGCIRQVYVGTQFSDGADEVRCVILNR